MKWDTEAGWKTVLENMEKFVPASFFTMSMLGVYNKFSENVWYGIDSKPIINYFFRKELISKLFKCKKTIDNFLEQNKVSTVAFSIIFNDREFWKVCDNEWHLEEKKPVERKKKRIIF